MSAVEWDASLSIGIASIDADHEFLFSLINELRNRLDTEHKDVRGGILLSLANYAKYHFDREEAIMSEFSDPNAETHQELHHRFLEDVAAVRDQYDFDHESVDFQAVEAFIEHWLLNHIISVDMEMKPVILANITRLAAVVATSSTPWQPEQEMLASRSIHRHRIDQGITTAILRLSHSDAPLTQILQEVLRLVLSSHDLGLQSQGCIFLRQGKRLVMAVQQRLSTSLLTSCADIPLGYCLCGRAGATGALVYAQCVDERHEITFSGMPPHGHYCMPIKFHDDVLGVLNVYVPPNHHGGEDELHFVNAVAEMLGGVIHRRRVESSLRASEENMRNMIENIGDCVIVHDINGKITTVNRLAHQTLGYSREEFILLSLSDIDPDFDAARHQGRWDALESLESLMFEGRFQRKNGSRFPVDVRCGQYFIGDIPHVVLMVRDISARVEAEDALNQARLEAERINQAKSEFLANMSHEIRTPINAVMGMNYLLQQTNLTGQQQDYLHKSGNAAQSLLGIINDILDFSKIAAGKLTIEAVEFRLSDVFERLADLAGGITRKKNTEMVIVVPADIPGHLVGDPARLGQILLNLVSNAVKFTAEGTVVVSVAKIFVDNPDNDQIKLRFAVRDTGIGMTPEQLSRLFQAFSQAESTTSRNYGGTGLGLTISKQLVEKMGGEISATSEFGVGSEFSFTATFGRSAKTQVFVTPLQRITGKRALVVDDLPLAREVMADVLTACGMDVTIAAGGTEALAVLAATHPFDIIVVDCQMPGMGGGELIRLIRGQPECGSPPLVVPVVVMVTPAGEDAALAEAKNLAVSGFLVKPVVPTDVLDAVLMALGLDLRKIRRGRGTGYTHSPGQQTRLHGCHILLVDDNEINQEIANAILIGEGASVQIEVDGEAALAAVLSSSSHPFDVVLMDIHMPVMDGYESTRRIRAKGFLEELPIIAMTADAMVEEREKCLAAGMNDHIAKPIDVETAIATLLRWLKPEQNRSKMVSTPCVPAKPGIAAGHGVPRDLPGFDVPAALLRIDGNEELLRRLLLGFARVNVDLAQRVRAALDEGDFEAAFQLVHAVKGSAGNLGAIHLFAAAAALQESLAPQKAAGRDDSHFEVFRDSLAAVLATLGELEAAPHLETHLEPHLDQVPELTPVLDIDDEKKERLTLGFQRLLELMNKRNMGAMDLADELKAGVQGGGFDPEIAAIDAALMVLDFKAGCVAVERVLGTLGGTLGLAAEGNR